MPHSLEILAARSAGRLYTPIPGRRRSLPTDHHSKVTEAVTLGAQHRLATIDNPVELAEAILADCRRHGKLFALQPRRKNYRTGRTELYRIDDLVRPEIAYNNCFRVSWDLVARYPLVLSTVRLDHLAEHHGTAMPYTKHQACAIGSKMTPEQIRPAPGHRTKGGVYAQRIELMRNLDPNPMILDFTIAQFDPTATLPWIGTASDWLNIYTCVDTTDLVENHLLKNTAPAHN